MSRIKALKGLAGVIALALAGQGQAFILDFQTMADGEYGESAYAPLIIPFTDGRYSGTVSINGQNPSGNAFAYLDARIGDRKAGLGVCPKLIGGADTGKRPQESSNVCDPSSDDNIRLGEQLTFSVDVTGTPKNRVWRGTDILTLWFSGTHDGDFDVVDETVLIQGKETKLPGNGWVTGPGKDNSIAGPLLAVNEMMTIAHGGRQARAGGDLEQFYISAMEISIVGGPGEVPIAGVMPLLGIGFLGMLVITRRSLHS